MLVANNEDSSADEGLIRGVGCRFAQVDSSGGRLREAIETHIVFSRHKNRCVPGEEFVVVDTHDRDREPGGNAQTTFVRAVRLGVVEGLFVEEDNIEKRMNAMKAVFPEMQLLETVKPSYIDRIMHYLNPRNQNETIYICRLY